MRLRVETSLQVTLIVHCLLLCFLYLNELPPTLHNQRTIHKVLARVNFSTEVVVDVEGVTLSFAFLGHVPRDLGEYRNAVNVLIQVVDV